MTGATSIFSLLSRSRPAAVVAPSRREPSEDPLLALFADWLVTMEVADTDEVYVERLNQLPAHFKPGNDGTSAISVYPELDLTRPVWRDWKIGLLGRRPSLQSVRLFNQWETKLGKAQDAAVHRAESRARVRLWIAAQRAQKAYRECLELPALDARRSAALDRAHDLELEILRTPARSVAGAAVKLKLWLRQTLGDGPVEHMDPAERAVVSALADLERLEGRVT